MIEQTSGRQLPEVFVCADRL